MNIWQALQSKWVHAVIVGLAAGAPAFFNAANVAEPFFVQAILGILAVATVGHAVASSQPSV